MWCHIKTIIISIFIISAFHYMYDFVLATFTVPKVKTISHTPQYKTEATPVPTEKTMEDELDRFMSTLS
jgi:hypothetical protein